MSKTNDPPPEAADVPVLVSIRLRNAKMVAARERRNYSQKLLAAITGVSVHTIGRLERFDLTSADVADRIDALADALGLTADDIAPPTMIGKEINHTLYSVENIAPEKLQRLNSPVARYTLPSPAAQAAQADNVAFAKRTVGRLLAGPPVANYPPLKAREIVLLKMRFGLGDDYGGLTYTLREVGLAIGITVEQVRQVEIKALKKLANRIAALGLTTREAIAEIVGQDALERTARNE